MATLDWAKKEVEIACKRERAGAPEGEWDYGCGCYESALKAFESLCKDGHSGMSIHFTRSILNRLIDGKPLTSIEDTEDVWEDCGSVSDNYTSYQCNRMGSLFKVVYKDGTIKYHDNDRIIVIDIDNDSSYYMGFVAQIVDEMFPITMPYVGGDTYKVYCEDFLFDKNNGDFDTIGVLYVETPEKETVNINQYFKSSSEHNGWEKIDTEEYILRKIRRFR